MSHPSLVARSSVRSFVAAALLLVGAAPAAQAQYDMRFDASGPVTGFGTDVGPAFATILSSPGMPGRNEGIIVNCVDISNNALYGQEWTAWFTNLGGASPSLAQTRQGAIDPDALQHYRTAAWLIDQYSLNPSTETAGIQGAIWLQFKSTLFPFTVSPTEQASVDSWIGQANSFVASAAYGTYDYSRFVIITDTTAVGMPIGGAQEFMARIDGGSVVTPEPGTVALLATGLFAVGGVARRRRVLVTRA